MIELEDSAQPIPPWRYLADFEANGTICCVSVDWLIRDDASVKSLAPNMGGREQYKQRAGIWCYPNTHTLRCERHAAT